MPLPANPNWDVGVNPTATYFNARIRDTIQWLRNRPHAILRKNATQNATSGTFIQVTWPTEDVDSDNGHNTVTNNSRYTVQTPGVYWLTATVRFSANAVGRRDAWFRVNGGTAYRYGWNTVVPNDVGNNADMIVHISAHIRLDINDYVEVTTLQDSGSTLTLTLVSDDPRFEILWVSK